MARLAMQFPVILDRIAHICGSRWQVEYDHIVPVARGGKSTVENVRLLCRAHNQYAAKQTFGAGFMEQKKKSAAA